MNTNKHDSNKNNKKTIIITITIIIISAFPTNKPNKTITAKYPSTYYTLIYLMDHFLHPLRTVKVKEREGKKEHKG